MTQDQYIEWRRADPTNRKAIFLQGTFDPIVIMGIPTGRDSDRLIEGFVIKSDTLTYPVGYASLAWCGENFEIIKGTVSFSSN